MKISYNNKIGKAVPLGPCDSTCSECIFYPDNGNIETCGDRIFPSIS